MNKTKKWILGILLFTLVIFIAHQPTDMNYVKELKYDTICKEKFGDAWESNAIHYNLFTSHILECKGKEGFEVGRYEGVVKIWVA